MRRFPFLLLMLGVLEGAATLLAGTGDAFKSDAIEAVFQFSLAPAGITASPDGAWLLSVSQTEKPRTRVMKVFKSGKVEPFPNEKMSEAAPDAPLPLDAVEGLQLGADELVWMLDNGRRGEVTPRIIAWNCDKNRLQHVHYIGQPAIVPGSYLTDLAIDPVYPHVYIADPANGSDAAIIVVDRSTGLARRVLQGHVSVVPDPEVTFPAGFNGTGEARRLDGVQTVPHSGVDPLALDRKGEWLYFAPLRSRRLYRVRTDLLRSAEPGAAGKLSQGVETYAEKPPATSISLDNKGNIYVGDILGRAIGVIEPEKREYRVLTSDPRLVQPDGLCFGQDGKLYFFSRSQFAVLARPAEAAQPALITAPSSAPEHSLFRMKALAPGRVGD